MAPPGFGRGVAYGAVACITWSFVFPLGRYLNILDVSPVFQAFGRFLVAGLILGGLVVLKKRDVAVRALRKDWALLFFLGITGIFGMGMLVFMSLSFTTSINGGILMNANPIIVVLMAPLVGEKITRRKLGGTLIGLVGCAMVIGSKIQWMPDKFTPPRNNLLGCAMAIGAALCWAVYTLAGKRAVRSYGGLTTTALAMTFGTLALAVAMIAAKLPVPADLEALVLVLFIGLVPTAIGFYLWYLALDTVDASILAPLQFIVPIGSVLLAWSFLHEPVMLVAILGMVLIFVGIMLAAFSRKGEGTGEA